MGSLVGEVATHVVRHHRQLRGGLARFGAMVTAASTGDEAARHAAARHAVTYLDRDVLAHADVEDALVSAVSPPVSAQGRPVRLGPSHDTLRDASAHLHGLVDLADTDRAGGVLAGTRDLLHAHLEDEWRELFPLLGRLDPAVAENLHDRFELAGHHRDPQPSTRVWVGADLATVTARIAPRGGWPRGPVVAAVEHAVARAATHRGVALQPDQGIAVDLVAVVAAQDITLLVGRLRSREPEAILAPVDFEVALVRAGSDRTTIELRHTLVPQRSLPDDVPAHELTGVAVHALAGELAMVSHTDAGPVPQAS